MYSIDKSWTLFLDRDGVINKRIPDQYIDDWSDFEFFEGTFQAIKLFSALFERIFIVTNQQGVGKQLMTTQQLEKIHKKMLNQITLNEGRIDKVYTCTALVKENAFCRKPNIGMPLQAKKEFPSINFEQSFMVGDSISDIEMGLRLKMKTVFIKTKPEAQSKINIYPIHGQFDTLIDFARSLQ